jgi:YidC/Oxa1 family membrane protein insertase
MLGRLTARIAHRALGPLNRALPAGVYRSNAVGTALRSISVSTSHSAWWKRAPDVVSSAADVSSGGVDLAAPALSETVEAIVPHLNTFGESFGAFTGGLAHLLEGVHVHTGLPWWASIVVTAVGARTLLLPFTLAGLRNQTIMRWLQPAMTRVRFGNVSQEASRTHTRTGQY